MLALVPAIVLLGAAAPPGAAPPVDSGLSILETLQKAKGSERQRALAATTSPSRDREEVAKRVALTVAGGVSLGAYQAGFLYYYTRFLQEYAREYDAARAQLNGPRGADARFAPLAIVTGASAGSINAFLAALTACAEPVDEPERSPFWDVWEDVGVSELRMQHAGKGSLLSDEVREKVAKRLRGLWGDQGTLRWSQGPCSVHVGVSATRLTARSIEVRAALSNYRLGEKFIFDVTRDHGSGPPSFRHFDMSGLQDVDPRFYPQLGWGRQPELTDVTDVLLASSAFPLAFPPRQLRYRLTNMDGSTSEESAFFIDGGVLDNQPVKLARALVSGTLSDRARAQGFTALGIPALLRAPALAQLADVPAPFGDEPQPDGLAMQQVYVDTSATAYGVRLPQAESIADRTPIGQYFRFLGDYVAAAGQSEFLDYAESRASSSRLAVPQRTLPVAGEHVMHFAAFAEKSFRRNDYYVGMVDAYQFLRRTSPQFWMLLRSRGARLDDELSDPVPIHSAEYDCYRLRIVTGRQGGCSHVDERLLLVLQECLDLKMRILLGDGRADLSDYFFEGLFKKGYAYTELADRRPLRAPEVRAHLREVYEDGAIALASDSDLLPRYVVTSVAREVGNAALWHKGPDWFFAVGAANRRGFDFTYSPFVFARNWRPSIALQLFNFDFSGVQYKPGQDQVLQPVQPGRRAIQNMPKVACNLGLYPRLSYNVFAGPIFQVELGGGYVAAARFTSDWANSFVYLRQGPAASATFLAFERFYVDLTVAVYVDSFVAGAYQRDDIIPVVGHRPTDVLVGMGWRFY